MFLPFLVIANNAAVNTGVQVLFESLKIKAQLCFYAFLTFFIRNDLADHCFFLTSILAGCGVLCQISSISLGGSVGGHGGAGVGSCL